MYIDKVAVELQAAAADRKAAGARTISPSILMRAKTHRASADSEPTLVWFCHCSH
jgi:hypothetical protein